MRARPWGAALSCLGCGPYRHSCPGVHRGPRPPANPSTETSHEQLRPLRGGPAPYGHLASCALAFS